MRAVTGQLLTTIPPTFGNPDPPPWEFQNMRRAAVTVIGDVHSGKTPAAMRVLLARVRQADMIDLVVTLAAMVDDSKAVSELLHWTRGDAVCGQGHQWTASNTRFENGARRCRSCDRERAARSRAKRRAEKAVVVKEAHEMGISMRPKEDRP